MKVKTVITAIVAFLVLDTIWIQLVVKAMYASQLSHLFEMSQGSIQVDLIPAIITYFILVFAVCFFAIRPHQCLFAMVRDGLLIGFVTYGTYDFTCFALFKGFTWSLSIIDVLWGMFICAVVAAIAGKVQLGFKQKN